MIKSKNIKILIIVLGFFLFLACTLFFFRNIILQKYIQKVNTDFQTKRSSLLAIKGATFTGLNTISLNEISFVPTGGDTLVKVKHAHIQIGLGSVFMAKPSITNFTIDSVNLTLYKKGGRDNVSFLLRKKEAQQDSIILDYGRALDKLLRGFFQKLPDKISATDIDFSFLGDSATIHAVMPEFLSDKGIISGQITFIENGLSNSLNIQGKVDKHNNNASIDLISRAKTENILPLLEKRFKTSLTFDTLHFSLFAMHYENDILDLKGQTFVTGFGIRNDKLCPEKVEIEKQKIDFHLLIGKNYFCLDSTSQVTVNKINFSPYLYYTFSPDKTIHLKIKSGKMDAGDFFSSLPSGMFYTASQLDAKGIFTYNLNCAVNISHPDSAIFEAQFKKENLKINPVSVNAITRINQSFDQTVYDKGKAVRSFEVGPTNPDFYPIMKISELLKNCILTAEDGAFFYHRGFNEEMFAKAIAENIRRGKFARGASTITMQMVKNVYLSRDKTISRKLEEALLVWLIENNRLISKERILEVYLNIIEWGPDIYGVGEASRFYFNKKPLDLTLEECIFLTSIIPNPKMFRYSFDKAGNLKGSLSGYFRLISGILLRKEVISQAEYNQLKPSVKITGKARTYILPPDSIMPSELQQMELGYDR